MSSGPDDRFIAGVTNENIIIIDLLRAAHRSAGRRGVRGRCEPAVPHPPPPARSHWRARPWLPSGPPPPQLVQVFPLLMLVAVVMLLVVLMMMAVVDPPGLC